MPGTAEQGAGADRAYGAAAQRQGVRPIKRTKEIVLENCFGMHGWKEFHRNRSNILSEYDRLRAITENRPVKTAHGEGVEAYWRKWLGEFLPQKWAVTSGYIIPTLYKDSKTLYHYDVVIYDALNSPILWTEGNADDSPQGRYRAIPARHVACVMEVKSSLTAKAVKDMAAKLSEVNEFSDQLSDTFFSAGLFVELRQSDNGKMAILKAAHELRRAYRFAEAIVLRHEIDETMTGAIACQKLDSDKPTNATFTALAKPIDDLNIYMSEDGNIKIAEGGGGVVATASGDSSWSMTKTISAFHQEGPWIAGISWSRSGFADYCINILARLEGLAVGDKDRPAFGRIFDRFERRPDRVQASEPCRGMPHIVLTLEKDAKGQAVGVTESDNGVTISYAVILENTGDTEAICSDDHFASTVSLQPGQNARKEYRAEILPDSPDGQKGDITRALEGEGLLVRLPLAYHLPDKKGEFYGIFKALRIFSNTAELEEDKELADRARRGVDAKRDAQGRES